MLSWKKRIGNEVKLNNYDYIMKMSKEELAEWLTKITDDAQLDSDTKCDYQWREWLDEEYK